MMDWKDSQQGVRRVVFRVWAFSFTLLHQRKFLDSGGLQYIVTETFEWTFKLPGHFI